jgi:hypothetical protein
VSLVALLVVRSLRDPAYVLVRETGCRRDGAEGNIGIVGCANCHCQCSSAGLELSGRMFDRCEEGPVFVSEANAPAAV